MIVDINNNCSYWLIECERNFIDGIFLTNHNVLDNYRLKVSIVDCDIDLLLSKSIFTSEITSLLNLKLCDGSVGAPFNYWLQNIDTTGG
jgi:hypothetical protein